MDHWRLGQDGPRCKCVEFKPVEGGLLCGCCGHKASMHRSDTAELPACGQHSSIVDTCSSHPRPEARTWFW
eukprot:6124316-Amphidinium_carterae.1